MKLLIEVTETQYKLAKEGNRFNFSKIVANGKVVDEAFFNFDAPAVVRSENAELKKEIEKIDAKWRKAIEKIKADIKKSQDAAYDEISSGERGFPLEFLTKGRYFANEEDLEIIDNHTKELMK